MTEHNNNDLEVHKASPEMKLFFRKLLNLKIYIEAAKDITGDSGVFTKIYEKLDEIIKESKS